MTAGAPGDVGTGSCGGGSAIELYVYYRVPTAHAAAAEAVACEGQRRVCAAHPGLTARLLRRSEADGAQQTWMEVYRFAGGPASANTGIDDAVQAAIEAHARPLAAFIDGARHVERFTLKAAVDRVAPFQDADPKDGET